MADDPFPRERLSTMVRRMPAYLRLSWHLAREPMLSKARRMAVVGAAGYLASPVDLVPGVVPVLGQLDDIAVAIAALRIALAGLSPEHRQRHLAAVGLGDEHLAEDLRTIGVTTAWIGRAGYRTTRRVAIAGGHVAQAGTSAAARTTRSALERMTPAARAAVTRASATAPAARSAAAKATPAVKASAARISPATQATSRAARDAGSKAVDAGGRMIGAAGAAIGRIPRPGRSTSGPVLSEPETLDVDAEGPLLPPPPPGALER